MHHAASNTYLGRNRRTLHLLLVLTTLLLPALSRAGFVEGAGYIQLTNNSFYSSASLDATDEIGQSFRVFYSGVIGSIGLINSVTSECRIKLYAGTGFSGAVLYDSTHTIDAYTFTSGATQTDYLNFFDLDSASAPEVIARRYYTFSVSGCVSNLGKGQNTAPVYNDGELFFRGEGSSTSQYLQFGMYRSSAPIVDGLDDLGAVEDVKTALDLSALSFPNASKISVSVDSGLLFASDGDGTTSAVTVSGSNGELGSSSLTFSGDSTSLANYFDSADKLRFSTAENSTSAVTVTIEPSGGGLTGYAKTATINITPVADPPTISGIDGEAVSTSLLTGSVRLFQADALEVSDPDSSNFDGYTLSVEITANHQTSEDLIAIVRDSAVTLSSGMSGVEAVIVEGESIGTLSGAIAAGNTLEIELNSSATPARMVKLLKNIVYENTAHPDPTSSTRALEVALRNGTADSDIAEIDLFVGSRDSDASISAAAAIDEPIAIASTQNASSPYLGILDFQVADGGTADGLSTNIGALELTTSGTLDPSLLDFTLTGGSIPTATATYSDGVLRFSSLTLSVADGTSEVFTISARFRSETPEVNDGATLVLSIDGAASATLGAGSSKIVGDTTIDNGTGSEVSVTATELRFLSSPDSAVSGEAFETAPRVATTDIYGNIDVNRFMPISIQVTSGSGYWAGWNPLFPIRGVASFNSSSFVANADQTTVILNAQELGDDRYLLTSATSAPFSVDVVASKLIFENARAFPEWGRKAGFSGPVVIHAVDDRGILDTDFEEAVVLSAAWEAADGILLLERKAGDDGVAQTETIAAVNGVVSVSDLSATFLNVGETSASLKASSGSLDSATSSPISVSNPVMTGTRSLKPGATITPISTAGQDIARLSPTRGTVTTPFIGQSFTSATTGKLTTLELALGYGNDTNCLLEIKEADGAQLHLEPFRIKGSYTAAAGTPPAARSSYNLADGGIDVVAGSSYTFTLSYCTFTLDYYQAESDEASAYSGGRAIINGAPVTGADLPFAAIITEPTAISGLPSSLSAVEDITRALVFKGITLTGSNTLLLSIDRGILRSNSGTGTFAGVTVSTGTRLIQLQGSAEALQGFLADDSRISFTTEQDDSRDATLTLTPKFNTDEGEAKTVAIAVAAVNDEPSIERFDETSTTFIEDSKASLSFSAINFVDADDDQLTVTLSTDKGLLYALDGDESGPISGVIITTENSHTGKLSIEFSGSASNLSSYLTSSNKFNFEPALDDTEDHILTLSYTDGIAAARSSATVLDITAVQDSPRIQTGSFPRRTIPEDESQILDFSSWDIRAPDSAQVSFALSAVNSEATFVLSGGNRTGLVTVTGSGSDSLTITASLSFLMALLDGSETITLVPKANATGLFFFGVTLADENGPATGDASGAVGVWTRAAVDDLPVILNLDGDNRNTVPGFGAQRLDLGGDAQITDVEIAQGTQSSFNGHSLRIQIDSNLVPAEDLLSFASDEFVSRTGDAVGSHVTVNGVTIGVLAKAISVGTSIEVTLNEQATIERVQTLVQSATYLNLAGTEATNSTRAIDFWLSNAAGTAGGKSRILLRVQTPDNNATLASAPAITEPVVVSTAMESTSILDFTLSDGGGDGYPLELSSLTFRLDGSLDPRSMIFTLDGPGVTGSERLGSYDHSSRSLTFPARVEIPDSGSAVYTMSVSFDTSLKTFGSLEGNTLLVSAVPSSDFNVADGATGFAEGSVTLTGSGTTLDVLATELVFLRSPSTSVSGTVFTQQPQIAAQDAYGNTDKDFTEEVSLNIYAGGGSLFGARSAAAVAGVASFAGAGYTAAIDGETVGLSADDDAAVGSNFDSINAALVTSDVRASKLIFSTQPGPARVNVAAVAWRDPVVYAVDASGVRDQDFDQTVSIRRIEGTGATSVTSASLASTGDGLGLNTTAEAGVATFTGLRISYTPNKANDSFRYRAEADGLTAVESDIIAANAIPSASALPTGLSALEDITSNLDLSGVEFADSDNEVISISLTTNRGKLIAASGDGIEADVTVSDSGGSAGSETITFSGTPAALNSFFESDSSVAYRSPANDSTDVSLTLLIQDDEISGVSRSATVAVAPVNDAPTITNIEGKIVYYDTAFGEWVLDNERTALVSDLDSDHFDGGFLRVAITENKQAGEDLLSFIDYFGKGILFENDAGSNVTVDWTTVIGTLENEVAVGNDLVVNFNSAATPARVQELVQAVYYNNLSTGVPTSTPRTITITLNDGSAQNSYALRLNTIVRDRDATVTAATSPLRTSTVTTDSTDYTPVFDFKVSDAGTADGIPTRVNRISIGIEGEIEPNKVEAQLSGPGLSPVSAEEMPGGFAFDLLASPLTVENGESADYTVSLRIKAGTVITDGTELTLKISETEPLETATNSTLLDPAAPVSLSSKVTIDVLASTYQFVVQPADSLSGDRFPAGVAVIASDAAGNRDTDYDDTVQLSATAAGSLSASTSKAVNGRADFFGTAYTASKDNEVLRLIASDDPSAGTDLIAAASEPFTSGVLATALKFATEPSPLTVVTGSTLSFDSGPSIAAVGAGDIVDEDFTGIIRVSGYFNSPSEGATLLLLGGSSTASSMNASAGLADFSGLELVFSAPIATEGNFTLRAEAEGLTNARSAEIAKADIAAVSGVLESMAVREDTLESLDFSAFTLTSKDDEAITLTFSVDKGALNTLHDPGLVAGVEISEVTETEEGSSVSFSGSGAALSDYLRRDGSLKFVSELNQADATLMTLHAESGDNIRKITEISLVVTPTNDAPRLGNIVDTSQIYTQGSGAQVLSALSAAVFADPDSHLSADSSIEVEITSNLIAREDKLTLSTGGEDNIAIATGGGAAVTVDGRLVGSLTEPFAEGRKIRLATLATASNADVQSLIRAISYENTNTTSPAASTREVTITVSDGEASSIYRVPLQVTISREDETGEETGDDPAPPRDNPAPPPITVPWIPEPQPIPMPLDLEGFGSRYPSRLVIKNGTAPYSAVLENPNLGHLRVEGNIIYLRGIRDGRTRIEVLDSMGASFSTTLEFRPWETAHSARGFSNFNGAVESASFAGGVSKNSSSVYRQTEFFSVGETFHLLFHLTPRTQDSQQDIKLLVAVIEGRRPDQILWLTREGRTVPFDRVSTVAFETGILTQDTIIDVTKARSIKLTPELRGDWYIFIGYELQSGEIIYQQEPTRIRVQ